MAKMRQEIRERVQIERKNGKEFDKLSSNKDELEIDIE